MTVADGRAALVQEREHRERIEVALANVSGALADAGGVVPGNPAYYGMAVRGITAQRDALQARLDAAAAVVEKWIAHLRSCNAAGAICVTCLLHRDAVFALAATPPPETPPNRRANERPAGDIAEAFTDLPPGSSPPCS